jgi:integrase
MSQSTKSARPRKPAKPEKPHKDFPLFAHAVGQWAKKVRGKLHYFGVWADPQAALEKWLAQKDDLLAGHTPRSKSGEMVMSELCGRFMTHKDNAINAGEITSRTYKEYFATCQRLVDAFGKNRLVIDLAADDFERLRADIAKVWGPVRLGNEIQRVRSVFKYGYEAGLIVAPVRFGPAFKRPSRKVLRVQRAEKGPRLFEPAEIKRMLNAANVPMKAMILLGLNCGFGNSDCAALPIRCIELAHGWVRFPRPKTGIERRCKLWPETIAAIRKVLAERKAPEDPAYADRVFVTRWGKPWATADYGTAVGHEFDKLLAKLGLKRPGLSFYTLRHVFRTVADGSRDQPAIDLIMGHANESMATHYREKIEDARLEVVADHVRAWLFGGKKRA